MLFRCIGLRPDNSGTTASTLLAFAMGLACGSALPASAQSLERAGAIGISLAGGEFGDASEGFSNRQTGQLGHEYTLNSPKSVQYFRRQGLRLMRLPFRWERIQRQLGQPLDAKHLSEIRAIVSAANSAGMFVVLDVHNYGRYRLELEGRVRECVIDESVAGKVRVSRHDFADLWRRLALEFRNDRAVIGYGLMNEPHDMGGSNWKQISQVAVTAIRRVDKRSTIIVAGDEWSNAERFAEINGARPWIYDPANNVAYEAHCYFDHDGSGKYQRSYAEELRSDPALPTRGVDRVRPFLQWCRKNKVPGFVGEFGTPADPAWKGVTQQFLRLCDQHNVAACYWAAGEWWGAYPLSIQPHNDFAQDATQLDWLKQCIQSKTRSVAGQR